MGVAENSEYGFKCNFWNVQQWATQSGNPNSSYAQAKLRLRVAMIFPDPLSLLECSVCQVIVFPVSLSSPEVY